MKTAAKDFTTTELGPIPKDWEVKRLGDVGEPLMCKRVLKSQTSDSGDVPFYKIGTFGGEADSFISQELFDSFRRQYSYPKKGDVLISAAGTIGRSVAFDGKDAYFQDSNIVWIGNDETIVSNEYLRWCYGTVKWHTEDGGTVSRLYNNNLRETLILVPPLPEQRKIAAALSDVDEMIAALERLIEKKRKIKNGAMQRLLTGKTRLPGFKGAWVEKRLGEVVEVLDNRRVPLNDSQRQSGPYPYCGANGIVDFIDRYIFDEEVILMAEDGGNFQDFANRPIAYKMRGKFWVNNHAHVLKAVIGIDQDFLFCQLVHKDITDTITGGTREKLTRGQLENLMVVFPPTITEQKAIAKVLGDMDEEIAAQEAELAKTRQLKQGMMQELLTGKTRLV